jgi:hypothetical protein
MLLKRMKNASEDGVITEVEPRVDSGKVGGYLEQ